MYFQIEGSNVRIGGSMHEVPLGQTLPDWVSDAIGWARHIVLEADPNVPPARAAQLARLPENQVVDGRLPNSWPRVVAEHPEWLPGLQALKPEVIALHVFFDGVARDPGVERLAKARAAEGGKTISYLENAETFLELATRVPDAVWDHAIGWVLDNRGIGNQVIQSLYTAWISGDPDTALAAADEGLLGRFPETRRVVLAERNHLWMPLITDHIATAEQSTLVLVGAAHLSGDEGLMALLTAQGLELRPLLDLPA